MRILLDECVDQALRLSFVDHDCQTARFAGLAGLKNGALLAAAEAADFVVLLTVDKSIQHQQNLKSFCFRGWRSLTALLRSRLRLGVVLRVVDVPGNSVLLLVDLLPLARGQIYCRFPSFHLGGFDRGQLSLAVVDNRATNNHWVLVWVFSLSSVPSVQYFA
jgi:hypothetical protein